MKKPFAALASLGLVLAMPIHAQSNDNDNTPLGSRIKRGEQFPDELPPRFVPADKLNSVERERTRTVFDQLGRCLYRRSPPVALDFLDKTDLGFVSFDQIGQAQDKALKIFGFNDCLDRVASANSSGVAVRFAAQNLRQWLIQAAYFDRYQGGPTWLKPGYVVDERQLPLSGGNRGVRMVLDFADCVVAADPNNADYFYRTPPGSPDEHDAVNTLAPSLGPCLPQGQQLQLTPYSLRMWIGEALWQAANHSAPPPTPPAGGGQ